MIYHCDHCRYDFEAERNPGDCPDCGTPGVREATDSECVLFWKLKEIVANESWDCPVQPDSPGSKP